MIKQASKFKLDGQPLFCARYGSGHINETYLLVDTTARQYILQKINSHVFTNPDALMHNIAAVTIYLKNTTTSHREVLTLIPTLEGALWHIDAEGEYWRMYQFVSDSIYMNIPDSPEIFRESALAFGRFQQLLADFDASVLNETIPRFHDTANRYKIFHQAIKNDAYRRVKSAEAEIEFALSREEYAPYLKNLLTSGDLLLRVTHNDTKLNNVLFDRETRKALCVIDLDTVMPGLCAHDFGDSIRFGASTAVEDETDLSKVHFSIPLFEAYCSGYLSACGSNLNSAEIETLRDGAKMMTLECGLRFLTDYLMGDTYFSTSRPEHNLHRCRTQFKLVAEMESCWDKMQAIVLRSK